MSLVRVTRAQLIKIMRTEPMCAGAWLSNRDKDSFGVMGSELKDCVGCAVGTIFCKILDENTEIVYDVYNVESLQQWIQMQANDAGVGSEVEAYRAAKDKRWLAALSHYFEYHASGFVLPDDAVREKMVSFIKHNFPPFIDVDINGFKPRVVRKKPKLQKAAEHGE